MERQHVHLSYDSATAAVLGARSGKPVVLRVLAFKMHEDGFAFYLAPNGVWLTNEVPPGYIEFPTSVKTRR